MLIVPRRRIVDPYYNNVALWLKFDGPNGSTQIIDSSPNPKTPASVSNVQISTAQSASGGSSLLCNVNSSIVYTGFQALGSGDWTIEFDAYRTAGTTQRALFDNRTSDANSEGLLIYLLNGAITVFYQGAGRITGAVLPLNEWMNVALVKSGNTVMLGQNQTWVGSTTHPFAGTSATTRIMGVFNQVLWGFDGHLDNYIITPGIARYSP